MFSGSTDGGGEVGEAGRNTGATGRAAKDGAEFLSPEARAARAARAELLSPELVGAPAAGVLAGKLEKPPCKTELTDISDLYARKHSSI